MPQLQFLFTQQSWFVKGRRRRAAGRDAIVREHTSKGTRYRQTDHFGFLAVENVKDVEDVVRRTLIRPWLAAEERGEDPATATGQVATEEMAKKQTATPAEAMDAEEAADDKAFADPNEKDLPLATRAALMKWETPPHLKDRLAKELTRGEKLVWTGKPSVLLVILNALILPAGAMLLTAILVLGVADLACWMLSWPVALKFAILPFLYLYLLWGFTVRPLWRWFRPHARTRPDEPAGDHLAAGPLRRRREKEYRPDELVYMRRFASVVLQQPERRVGHLPHRHHEDHANGQPRAHLDGTTTTHYGFLDIADASAVERLIGVVLLASLKQDGKGTRSAAASWPTARS
jgi:hypothetical protein